jgi:predicted amino acid racemase
MAYLTLNKKNLEKNYLYLKNTFLKHTIEWAIVSKLLCGNKKYLSVISDLGIQEICDSRVSNLKLIKEINPEIQTVYIKPPAKRSIPQIVKYADASFNTEIQTIKWLSEEAVKQDKLHKVIIMIELGDLREGVMGEELMDFYDAVFRLPKIRVTAIGSNLNCLHGVMPSEDKLIQLSLYKQLIEAKFNRKIPWVTGGTSVVLPLLKKKQVPKGINHFRIGETLFFGNNLVTNEIFPHMSNDIFTLYAEIIELHVKPIIPIGEMEANPSGVVYEIDEENIGKTTKRAIIDIGLLDISPDFLILEDSRLSILGASSDMIVIDLGDSGNAYKVGDLISFKLKYMGALGIMNSNYIDKRVV